MIVPAKQFIFLLTTKIDNILKLIFNYFSFDSNYATAERDFHANKTKSLQVIIKDLKNRVENKNRVTKADLKSLLAKLTTQKANAEEALEILSCCSFARLDEHQASVVKSIWNELKNQNQDLQIQHYNRMLFFARDRSNIKLAEEIWDEIKNKGLKPDA